MIKRLLSQLRPALQGMDIEDYLPMVEQFRRQHSSFPMTISGLEIALFRSYLASQGVSEHTYWGGREVSMRTDITIPLVKDKAFLMRWIDYGVRKGFSAYKLKVSGQLKRDMELISFVHSQLKDAGEGFCLRLDGNQGYDTRTFLQIADRLEKKDYAIELFEQPLRSNDTRGLKEITKRSPFPIILDETVLTGGDAERVAQEGLAHGINIKTAKSGIVESRAILDTARRSGLKLMVGCMMETMVGLSAGIYLAAGTGSFDYVDLDAIHFLYHKNTYGDISLKGPCFKLKPGKE